MSPALAQREVALAGVALLAAVVAIAATSTRGTNSGGNLNPLDTTWFYAVGNSSTQTVTFNLRTDVQFTNDNGNFVEVLSNLNNTIGTAPYYYRYESGTSMSAADVSGVLFTANLTAAFTDPFAVAYLRENHRAGPAHHRPHVHGPSLRDDHDGHASDGRGEHL